MPATITLYGLATVDRNTINVNLRQQPGANGFFEAELPPSTLGVPAPTAAPTIGTAAGGTQAARTEFFRYSLVTPAGESVLSPEASASIPVNSVATIPSPTIQASSTVTSWRVYGSTATGTETLQATLAIGTAYTEPNTGLVAGAAIPAGDTTSFPSGNCTITITAGP